MQCPECGAPVGEAEVRCPACDLPLPHAVPPTAITEPWYRNPMVRLAVVTAAAIIAAVAVILTGNG